MFKPSWSVACKHVMTDDTSLSWCINWFTLSSHRWKHARRKPCTVNDHIAYVCLRRNACVTIIQDEVYWIFWTEVELFMAYRWSKFNLYCLLYSCRNNSKLNFSFAQPLWPCIKIKVIESTMSIHIPCINLPSCQVWML